MTDNFKSQYSDDAARHEFKIAVIRGRLSRDSKASNYAGNFMFMGWSDRGFGNWKPEFKSILTREYLA